MDSSSVVIIANVVVAWVMGWFHAMPGVPDPLARAITVFLCGALYWVAAGCPAIAPDHLWPFLVNMVLFVQSVKGTQSDLQGTPILPSPNTFKPVTT